MALSRLFGPSVNTSAFAGKAAVGFSNPVFHHIMSGIGGEAVVIEGMSKRPGLTQNSHCG